jgi:hypothetical protein
MNEEEVKARIILPWLHTRGIVTDDLDLETTFKVKVGRQVLSVGGRTTGGGVVHPRLDVLVRRGDLHLLVIETKAGGLDLTEDDRDQAICYARLVHPIAPYALVTNGREFRLFDAITKIQVKPESVQFDGSCSIALPDEARLQALRLFFDLSPTNLRALCTSQVELEIQGLTGPHDDFGAVFIADAHVPRNELPPLLRRFLGSDRSTFVLVGESGMGKTCSMIDLVHSLLNQGLPTFFFRGACMASGITDAVSAEIEWAFGGPGDPVAVLRRIASLDRAHPLVIVVDGLEDWAFSPRVQDLAFLIHHAGTANVRVIVSCKSRVWSSFLSIRGSRTGIHSNIFEATLEQPYSHELLSFTPQQFYRALQKYRVAFQCEGLFETSALQHAQQNLFVLRLLFQVASQSGAPYVGFSSLEFFQQYLELLTSRTAHPEVALNTLVEIARVLVALDQEWVDEHTIRSRLRLSANETIDPTLFDQRILVRSGPLGVKRIAFAFTHLRNYLAAFAVCSWPSRPAASLTTELAHADPKGLMVEVAAFYYSFATLEHKRAIDGPLYDNALAFLRTYVALIEQHFPELRFEFIPHTAGRIGFVAELLVGPRVLGFRGFRPISQSDDEVMLLPVSPASDSWDARHKSNALQVAGAANEHYTSSANGFLSFDIAKEVLVHEVWPQIQGMLEKGRLNETGAPVLTEELVVGILHSGADVTHVTKSSERFVATYPISLEEISRAFQRADLRSHFEEMVTRAKRERGEIRETWRGNRVSYSLHFSDQERALIEDQVEAAISSGEPVRLGVRNVDRENLKGRLEAVMRYRKGLGNTIASPSVTWPAPPVAGRLAHSERLQRIREVFEIAVDHYRTMVEVNFPTLKRHFVRYSVGPTRLLVVLPDELRETDARSKTTLYWCQAQSAETRVDVLFASNVSVDADNSTVVTASGQTVSYGLRESFATRTLVTGPACSGLEYPYPGAVIRRWVYNWLRTEVDSMAKALFELYGLSSSMAIGRAWP